LDEFTTKTKELKIAIPPCMKRKMQEKITRRVLSSLVAVSNRGNVSTAVHIKSTFLLLEIVFIKVEQLTVESDL